MLRKMRYRLGLDLGTTSIGWAMVRLNDLNEPHAIIKAGVRIFSDGRHPKTGTSLAVARREARGMRRRRDRLLKRKSRLMKALIDLGFFPENLESRRALANLNPYQLRAEGLSQKLNPAEFARALFHINQRRGFKSNRKTDKGDNESGALKGAISKLREDLKSHGARTVGEFLYKRQVEGGTVRARYRQTPVVRADGKKTIDKSYDLYIDRAMIEHEFDTLWSAQHVFDPTQFSEGARAILKDILLFQRKLRPVKTGRCTLIPSEERAPLALPSVQRFRIYQELNNLRLIDGTLGDEPLAKLQRDQAFTALERNTKRTFTQMKRLMGLDGQSTFNIEDDKRNELKGNSTTAVLSAPNRFGGKWFEIAEGMQDEIVLKLLNEEDEGALIDWLVKSFDLSEECAEKIANSSLADGHGSLSLLAIKRVLPELIREVITYDKAVIAAGFEHHSLLSAAASGEILEQLPYYGRALQRHVGFGSGVETDSEEKRFGKIANPTVHIALNQVRLVVNELIGRYGHPSEVIVELARDLKQSKAQRDEDAKRQAENQRRNIRLRKEISELLQISDERVSATDIHKMILWEELSSSDVAGRRCPYSGVQISARMLMSPEVEIEHILPFSRTLDDSLNNKTVSMRQANRLKGNDTPWEAFGKKEQSGYIYEEIIDRALRMPLNKRYRFAENGYEKWLKEDAGFLARALNDTRYLSRIAKEYLSLICPNATRAIPGQMTAMLRGKFGLNRILSGSAHKTRDDHRHHAIDACVVAVTDQGLLQRFASASASARTKQLNRLVEDMPLPWDSFPGHVDRAINSLTVSHRPDHGYEGAMHNDTAYGLREGGKVSVRKVIDGVPTRMEEMLTVIPFTDESKNHRHGLMVDGSPKPYKGYKGDSNYCLEIVKDEKGLWKGETISTFAAYQIVRRSGVPGLRNSAVSFSAKPLVMRLCSGDYLRFWMDNSWVDFKVVALNSAGTLTLCEPHEANVDARNREKSFKYTYKTAGSLQKLKALALTVSPAGALSKQQVK